MKKNISILSILLMAAIANANESGYTESIVQSIRLQSLEKKSADDYDNLDYNPNYREIYPFEWDTHSILPDIQKSEGHPNGFDGIPIECYSKDPPSYCYDPKDFKEAAKKHTIPPIIYASIELGKEAKIKTNIGHYSTKPAYDEFYIIHEYEYDEKKELKKINSCHNARDIGRPFKGENHEEKIEIKKINDGGIYTLCGGHIKEKDIKKKGTDEDPSSFHPFLKINIIPYEKITKKFVFIELNGDGSGDLTGWNPLDEDSKKDFNIFTAKKTLDYFNKVYKQAVVNAEITIGRDEKNNDIKINEETTAKDINDYSKSKYKFSLKNVQPEFPQLIEIDMTNEDNNGGISNRLKSAAADFFAKYGDVENRNSSYYHIVFAINKVRKKWDLSSCLDEKSGSIDLTFCNGFNPEGENSETKYYIMSPDEACVKDEGGIGTSPQKVDIKKKNILGETHYYALQKGELVPYARCDVLFTENGYPIIPDANGLLGVSYEWTKKRLDVVRKRLTTISSSSTTTSSSSIDSPDSDLFNDYLPYGSFIFMARGPGEEYQYILMHELGHSFGLTDVVVNNENLKYSSSSGGTKVSGTTETNLMTWASNSGSQIRYRETPVACTEGKIVILKLNLNKDNKPCKGKEVCKEIFYELKTPVENEASGEGDKQWDCIRDCFTDDLETSGRKKYWSTVKEISSSSSNECSTRIEIVNVNEKITIKGKKKPLKNIVEDFIKEYGVESTAYLLKDVLKYYYTCKEAEDVFGSGETILDSFCL